MLKYKVKLVLKTMLLLLQIVCYNKKIKRCAYQTVNGELG